MINPVSYRLPHMRGVSTFPIVLAIVTVAVAAGVYIAQWWWAAVKAAELEARWAQKVAEYKTLCLSALSDGQYVIVGSYRGTNYTAPNCYVSPNMVVVAELNRTEWR
ncbi:MAG: hypothetical protein QXI07_05455 [Pyrobaculum sp.]